MTTVNRLHVIFFAASLAGLAGYNYVRASEASNCVGFSAADIPQPTVNCETGAESAGSCTVDARTASGFEIYRDNCAQCHGHGTGVALGPEPKLEERSIDYEKIHFILYHGHDEDLGVMPAWKGNCNVIPMIDEIYLYLKARTDGGLPAGKPNSE